MKEPSKGRILISEPFLEDPNFNRTVVLITEHGDEGSVGYVLNHSTAMTVDLLMPNLEEVHNIVYQGGPVEVESFHYIHSYPQIKDAVDLGNGVYWSGNYTQVTAGLISGELDPQQFRFFIGYSGWAVGQLQEEIDQETWVVGTLNKANIFNTDMEDQELWKAAMTDLGGEFALLINAPSNPQLN